MAIFEQLGKMTYIDTIGDQHILYPVTKKECVEGLSLIEDSIGNIQDLETNNKLNLVAAINEARNTGSADLGNIQQEINNALERAKLSGDFDGRGIVSVLRTDGTGEAGTVDTYTITYSDGTTSQFNIYNGANGSGGNGTENNGENGATFTPHVDSNGYLSWSNDKGLKNPETVNIKGYTPIKNVDYYDGEDGFSPIITTKEISNGNELTILDKNGSTTIVIEDGIPVTHRWDGTTLSVTSASGTSSANLVGQTGEPGIPGIGITKIEQTTTSSVSGGVNTITITMSDGNSYTFDVKNGTQGVAGQTGVGVSGVEQTTTSSADGGANVITVTLSDGTTSKFTIMNGSKGSSGSNGLDAKINGVNTLTLNAGDGIKVVQSGSAMTISANYEYGVADLIAGSSPLETGKLYLVYE